MLVISVPTSVYSRLGQYSRPHRLDDREEDFAFDAELIAAAIGPERAPS